MKNSDMPAMPIPNGADGRPRMASDLDNPNQVIGLTKRELFAGMAMQAILSRKVGHNAVYLDEAGRPTYPAMAMANLAVESADALLATLEKGNG